MVLTCWDFEKAGLWDCNNCCSSCHHDAEYFEDENMYQLAEAEPPPNKHGKESDHYASVCCALRSEKVFSRSHFARVLSMKKHERRGKHVKT